MINFDNPIHVYPLNDVRPHLLSKDCPCNPTARVEAGMPIVVHNAFDHREFFEELKEWFSDHTIQA